MTLLALEDLYQEAIRENRATLASELAQVTFADIIVSGRGSHRFDSSYSFATHSIFGPYAATMQPVKVSSACIGFDPNGPTFFGWNDGLVIVDPETGTTTEFVIDGLEKQAPGVRIAFDSTRHRLLLWRKDLVAIDLLEKTVLPIREGNPDIRAIAYSKPDDRIYALCAPYDGNSHDTISEIRTYNHRGAELSAIPLKVPLTSSGHPFDTGHLKITLVADKLLVTFLGGRDDNGQLIPSHYNYVVDPKTGVLLFACKREPR